MFAQADICAQECYEPLWDDMQSLSRSHNFSIRGIWAADSSQQGASGVLNEHTQGDDSMIALLRADEIPIRMTKAQLLGSTILEIYSSW